mgnify:CR=1 FL=1
MKILIIKTSALGDCLQCFSALHFLRAHEIDWVVEKPFADLLAAHPFINKVITIETKKWKKKPFSLESLKEFSAFRSCLRGKQYDLIFDLQGNIKSGLITALSKGKKKVGWTFFKAAEWPSSLFVTHRFAPSTNQSVSSQYLEMVQHFFPEHPSQVSSKISLTISLEEREFLETSLSKVRGVRFMICMGSNWKNKQLTLSTWKAFLDRVDQKYTSFFFFVWGSEAEKEEAKIIQKYFSRNSVLLPKMSVPLWQNMMGKMDLIFSVDSAALHLAATTSTPTFSFFGPSSKKAYLPTGPQHGGVQGQCPYKKTFQKRCPRLRTCLTAGCLKDIES